MEGGDRCLGLFLGLISVLARTDYSNDKRYSNWVHYQHTSTATVITVCLVTYLLQRSPEAKP